MFKLVEGIQTGRGAFFYAIAGGDSRAVYCFSSRTLENTEILLKATSKIPIIIGSCNDISVGNEFINVTTNDGYLFRVNMFKVRSEADDDILGGDSDEDDEDNIMDPNFVDDDDGQAKASGDYEDGGK